LKEFKEGSKSLQVLELCHLCLLEADWAPLETVVMDEEMPEMAPFLSPECCHQIGLWLQKLCQRLKTLLDTHIDIKAHAKDLVKAIALVEAQRLPKWHGAHPSGRKILRLEATIEEEGLPKYGQALNKEAPRTGNKGQSSAASDPLVGFAERRRQSLLREKECQLWRNATLCCHQYRICRPGVGKCEYAHTEKEAEAGYRHLRQVMRRKDASYKSKMCLHFLRGPLECSFGIRCKYAHGHADLICDEHDVNKTVKFKNMPRHRYFSGQWQ